MKTHICQNPNCGKIYQYCRGCLISPILYKELGFCSEKCHNEFKKQKEVIQQDVEVVITDEDTSTSEEE